MTFREKYYPEKYSATKSGTIIAMVEWFLDKVGFDRDKEIPFGWELVEKNNRIVLRTFFP